MISTAGSEREANRLARTLIQERLAACVNVVPGVTSYFYWGGKICREKEALLVVKTVRARLKEIIHKVKEIHSYEVPEIFFLRVETGEKKYLQWVKKMTQEDMQLLKNSPKIGKRPR